MDPTFAARMHGARRSFIREILKVTADPEVISFAGGLPNPATFPVAEISAAAVKVLAESGAAAPQYSATEGYAPLREWIAQRCRARKGLDVAADDILITTGSQQALDLAAKIFIDAGDPVVIEKPGYLGAIQAFSLFRPGWRSAPMEDDGPDLAVLARHLEGAKLFYAVTSFQNPSGLSYSRAKREAVAGLLERSGAFFLEDDPYGELRFAGEDLPPVYAWRPERSVLLGTFSKIAAPGFRLGWMVCRGEIRERLVIAKQAADLHTGSLDQMVVWRFLEDNDIDAHIARIRDLYRTQCEAMLAACAEHFPAGVRVTRPQGGMFLWAEMPESVSSMELLTLAVQRKVAFVPGDAFFVDGAGGNTLRLNFSNSDPERIREGVLRLGECMRRCLGSKRPA